MLRLSSVSEPNSYIVRKITNQYVYYKHVLVILLYIVKIRHPWAIPLIFNQTSEITAHGNILIKKCSIIFGEVVGFRQQTGFQTRSKEYCIHQVLLGKQTRDLVCV